HHACQPGDEDQPTSAGAQDDLALPHLLAGIDRCFVLVAFGHRGCLTLLSPEKPGPSVEGSDSARSFLSRRAGGPVRDACAAVCLVGASMERGVTAQPGGSAPASGTRPGIARWSADPALPGRDAPSWPCRM